MHRAYWLLSFCCGHWSLLLSNEMQPTFITYGNHILLQWCYHFILRLHSNKDENTHLIFTCNIFVQLDLNSTLEQVWTTTPPHPNPLPPQQTFLRIPDAAPVVQGQYVQATHVRAVLSGGNICPPVCLRLGMVTTCLPRLWMMVTMLG